MATIERPLVTLRAFQPTDYEPVVAVLNAAYPEYGWTVAELTHWDDGWERDRFFKRRVVAEEDGTIVGYSVSNTYFFVLFLALAAGALIYIISEMFNVGRKLNTPSMLGWGVLLGFLAGYGTDLILTFAGT